MSEENELKGFKVEPLSWQVHDVRRVQSMPVALSPEIIGEEYGPVLEDRPIYGFAIKELSDFSILDNHITADDLPVEFFNHQLLEYDTSSEEDLIRFISEWGMPYSPQRNSKYCLVPWGTEISSISATGINETRHLELAFTKTDVGKDRLFREKVDAGEIDIDNYESELMKLDEKTCRDTRGHVISIAEASVTLFVLQQASRMLTEIAFTVNWSSDELDQVIGTLMAGSCNPLVLKPSVYWYYSSMSDLDIGLSSRGMLTSAICNQMLEAVADEAPWRKCQCEGCGKVFKRKQSKSNNPDSDSIYCCDKCMERQKKRNQRAAAKNRIQH